MYHIVRGSPRVISASSAEEPISDRENGEDRIDHTASNQRLLWYPPAARIPGVTMPTRGIYPNGYPQGAVVHFTAGRSLKGDSDAISTVIYGAGQGFAYLCISNDGTVFQAHPLDRYGNHAGTSRWPDIGGDVSRQLVGIEICCAGHVTPIGDNKFKSWFGEIYNASQVRHVKEEDYGCPTGYYHKYTPEQELALVQLLLWLKSNNPDVFNFDYVLAHHEVSGKKGIGYFRKNDCGGALSITMDQLRAHLKEEYMKQVLSLKG